MTCYVLIESSLVWLLKNKGTTEITSRELLLFGHTSVFMIPPRLRDISKTLFSDTPINIHKVAQHVPDVPIIFVKHAVKTVMLSLICDPCLLGKNKFFDACPTPTTATMSLGTTLPYSLIFHCSNLDHTENS